MNYKIGDMANLLGISQEAVRFYEKQGLINPRRDKKNGYRLYHAVDLNVLMRLRAYTSYGYTVNEAIALFKDSDLFDLSASLEERSQVLHAQIEADHRLLLCAQLRERHLHRVSGMLGECTIENSPAMYGIVYRSNLDISEDMTTRALVRDWMQMRPFSEALLLYNKEYWTGDSLHVYSQGLCIDALFARRFGIETDERVLHFPSTKSVYTIAKIPYEAWPEKDEERTRSFDYARAFIKEKGLRVTGDSYGRTLHTSMKAGEYVHYCEQWIPVE